VAAWRTNSFDDTSWSDANAAFYYGETLTGTLLSDMNAAYSCIFMRKSFNVVDPAQVTGMELRTLLDDGCIVWINGFEVLRTNMPLGNIAFNGTASAALDPELLVRIHPLPNPAQYLLAGQNTIAIQAFNSALSGSTDFVIDAQLLATIPDSTPPTVASTVPAAGSVSSLSQITVNFSEPVEDVEVTDLLIQWPGPGCHDESQRFELHVHRSRSLPMAPCKSPGWHYTIFVTTRRLPMASMPRHRATRGNTRSSIRSRR
jgi:hypothetical protein